MDGVCRQKIVGQEALRIGLVEEVSPDNDVMGHAEQLWRCMAANSTYALIRSKCNINHCFRDPSLMTIEDTPMPLIVSLNRDECRDALMSFQTKSVRSVPNASRNK
jgi:enoyl-CoA hydratase/carnithine racemase